MFGSAFLTLEILVFIYGGNISIEKMCVGLGIEWIIL